MTIHVSRSPSFLVSPEGVSALGLLSAPISVSSSGDNVLIAGTGGQTIRVYKIALTVAGGSLTFKDGDTNITGPMLLTAISEEGLFGSPLFTLTPGNSFVAGLSMAASCAGVLWYTKG